MTNKIIVIARIVKDAITYHLIRYGFNGGQTIKKLLYFTLSHSHTFIFRPCSFSWHYLAYRWRFIYPTHNTIASAAANLCSGDTYLKLYQSRSLPTITSTSFIPLQLSFSIPLWATWLISKCNPFLL